MDTFQEQKQFFEERWPAMKEALEADGAAGVVRVIEGHEDDLERRVLYVFARTGLVMGDWEGKSFAPYLEVCDAGIAEMLRQAEAAPDEDTRKKRVNGAHVVSYNLAADLADCWPDDDAPRTEAHFRRALKAAEDCLEWCDPSIVQGLAQDHWVRGMHQISLGDVDGAVTSWETSFELARQIARDQGEPDEVSPEAGFGVILGGGYVGIGRAARGEEEGRERLAAAIRAFTAQLADEKARDDASFGIAQLQNVASKYAPEA